MTIKTNATETTPEANTYRISSRQDGWANLIASGIGIIGIIRKPQIVRDIYTCEQLLAISPITGLKRDGLESMLKAAAK